MAVERFETRNSVYEIDQDEKLIRRVSGVNEPTKDNGEDGIWQPYVRVFPVGTGSLFVELTGHQRGFITSTLTTDLDLRYVP